MKQFIAALSPAWLIAAGHLFALMPGAMAAEPMEDVDYVLVVPQPVAVPGKIEVIEFFHYGCESCNRLEPQLQSWLKTVPHDTSFRRVPALRRMAWVPLTRVYFALEQLGEIERLHMQVYQVVHEGGLNLGNSTELRAWAQKSGLDSVKLEQMLDSDLVRAQVQRARDATVAYGIRATPSFVVDGKYMTSGRMAGSLDALLPIVDGLIDKARAARALK
ncbi:MAG: thiol:disulfide interchange protein DsbA/DsbL [Betaproteobacteria bacterium]|nr:thiol:disulfide interchange protein DsbA/DsbL [Betaproteobacteria bacterium]